MKILKININGLHKFKDNRLEIEFEPHKFVRRNSITNDIDEVLPELFIGNIFCVCGLYNSGKSSVIEIIKDSYNILLEVINAGSQDYSLSPVLYKDEVDFSIYLLIDEDLYNVKFSVKDNHIINRYFFKKRYLKSYYVNEYLYEFTNNDQVFKVNHENTKNVCFQNDIQKIIQKYDSEVIDINDNMIFYAGYSLTINDNNTISRLYKLLKEICYTLNNGGVLIVDDLDKILDSYLLEQIFNFFMNQDINRNYATLIFSSKNFQTVDLIKRIDNIYYVYNDEFIQVDNLSKYVKRNEIRKSSFLNDKWEQKEIDISEVLNGSD